MSADETSDSDGERRMVHVLGWAGGRLNVDRRSHVTHVFDGVEQEGPSTDFIACVAFFVISPAVVYVWSVVSAEVP